MTDVKAQLNSLHIAPRKVRLVADSLKGLSVKDAEIELQFREKKASGPLAKLLRSAVANARNNAEIENPEETLYVKNIRVNEGRPFKRFMPRAHGRATQIKKRTSHVTLILSTKSQTL
ncbi:50S ribosomal protein L22 [Patescibacteria group bacterium]